MTKRKLNTVDAFPTKTFFMSMLTRDIDLSDAIMDLLDNCIDGVHRVNFKNKVTSKSSYTGYFAKITITKDKFSLEDNCGGIPLDVAENYAFKLGRDNQADVDQNLETVGVYGIGMKRAIFKMGDSAQITSRHNSEMFQVEIPKNWINETEWVFNYKMLTKAQIKSLLGSDGTLIEITDIKHSIKEQFGQESTFLKNLSTLLKQHYGYIIQQGFTITLNGEKIPELDLKIIAKTGAGEQTITPYVFYDKIDDVDVEIVIGFYRPFAEEAEIDDALKGNLAKSRTDNAGITVICNDRIVLYCDKSYLTGWGDTPVPKYHTQFISIAGTVHFRSKSPVNLPVTTTKRGLDTSSQTYNAIKERIKDGLKLYTGFTNSWKSGSEERNNLFQNMQMVNALEPGVSQSKHFALTTPKKSISVDAGIQIPKLPKPMKASLNVDPTISFKRSQSQIDELCYYFHEGKKLTPHEVGAWCFDEMYKITK